jgi:uncharacterized radical SAM superfamily Fe-S cluster-containing enzyme
MDKKNEGMNILRETKSFDPETGNIVSAQIVEKNKKVYLVKENSARDILLENDPGLFKMLMSVRKSDKQSPYRCYVFRTTYQCNSHCRYCFARSPLPVKDITAQDISNFVKRYKRKLFLLSGGEPTLRKDLPLIIQDIIHSKNTPLLITNGIKLADYAYLQELKNAGLKNLCFSFNGFSDDIYEMINGRPYLAIKLKALANIKKSGLKIILGYLVVKEINDKSEDFEKVFDYFLSNKDFIREIAFRAAASLGRFENHKKLMMSEMIDVLSRSFKIDKSDIINEIGFIKYLDIYFNTNLLMPCRIDLFFKLKKNALKPIIRKRDLEKIEKFKFKRIALLYYALKFFGILTWARLLIREIGFLNYQSVFYFSGKIVKISLRLWPSKETIDLGDLKNCQEAAFDNGRPVPRCYALITDEFSSRE